MGPMDCHIAIVSKMQDDHAAEILKLKQQIAELEEASAGRYEKHMAQVQYITKLQEALALLLKAFDALLPGAASIAVDVGLLNDAACKARPLVTAANRGREIWHGK